MITEKITPRARRRATDRKRHQASDAARSPHVDVRNSTADIIRQKYNLDTKLSEFVDKAQHPTEAVMEAAWLSAGMPALRAMVENEMSGKLVIELDSGRLAGIGLLHFSLSQPIAGKKGFEAKEVVKLVNSAKKGFQHAVGHAYPLSVFVPGETPDFAVVEAVTFLAWTSDDGAPTPRMSTANPMFPADQWKHQPDAAAIRNVVRRFMSVRTRARRLASDAGREQDPNGWSNTLAARRLNTYLLDLFTPITKVFRGEGKGEEILGHALTGPNAHLKKAKKKGMTLAQAQDQFWRYHLEHQMAPVPFVNI